MATPCVQLVVNHQGEEERSQVWMVLELKHPVTFRGCFNGFYTHTYTLATTSTASVSTPDRLTRQNTRYRLLMHGEGRIWWPLTGFHVHLKYLSRVLQKVFMTYCILTYCFSREKVFILEVWSGLWHCSLQQVHVLAVDQRGQLYGKCTGKYLTIQYTTIPLVYL